MAAATSAQALLFAAKELEKINRVEEAESLLAKAHAQSQHLEEHLAREAGGAVEDPHRRDTNRRYRQLIFDVYLTRGRIADAMGLHALCSNNLAQALATSSTILSGDQESGVAACREYSRNVIKLAHNAYKTDPARALHLYESALEAVSNSLILSDRDSELSGYRQHIYIGLVRAHLVLGRAADASRCWSLLETTPALAHADDITAANGAAVATLIHFLGVKVKLATQEHSEALAEAQKLVGADGATLDHVSNIIGPMVENGLIEDAAEILWTACDRFNGGDTAPIVAFVKELLTKGKAFNEEMAIRVAGDSRLMVLSQTDIVQGQAASESRRNMYRIMWNHGCSLYGSKEWEKAATFFSAALSYAPLVDRPRVARALSYVHLCNKDIESAGQHARQAEEYDPSSALTAMLSFMLQIYSGAPAEETLAQLEKLTLCDDFEHDMLEMMHSEAKQRDRADCAESALFMLFQALGEEHQMVAPGREANVIRNTIKMAIDRNADGEQLSNYITAAANRFTTVGFDRFFGAPRAAGPDVGGGPPGQAGVAYSSEADYEVLWIANRAFIAGRDHVSLYRWRLAQPCLKAAATFYSAMLGREGRGCSPELIDKARAGSFSSAILYALAALQVQDSDNANNDEQMAEIAALLERASGLNSALSPAADPDAWKTRTRFLKMLTMETLIRLNKTTELTSLVNGCRADAMFSGAHFFAIGVRCAAIESSIPMSEVAYESFSSAVQMLDMMSESRMCLSAFRRLIMAAESLSRDSLVHYVDAAGTLEGKTIPEEAQDECFWLGTTCWNKGRELARTGKSALALEWLRTALNICKYSSDIAGHITEMENSIRMLEDGM